MKHARRHLGHARLARNIHQLPVRLFEIALRLFDGRDVLGNAEGAPDFLSFLVDARGSFVGESAECPAIFADFFFRLADERLAGADDFLFIFKG